MFYFKACTKCQGDLVLEQDSYGSFLKCLQCGTYIDVKEVREEQSVLRTGFSEPTARTSRRAKAKTAVAA